MTISEVMGLSNEADILMRDLFVFRQTGVASDGAVAGGFTATGQQPSFLQELKVKGIAINESTFEAAPEHG
jgi:pilus assembly protein CpaF